MPPGDALPNGLRARHTLIRQKDELIEKPSAGYQTLRQDFERLKRFVFGRRSERYVEDNSQLTHFAEESDSRPVRGFDDAAAVEGELTNLCRKRKASERFPESLSQEVQVVDVPAGEPLCRCCGDAMAVSDSDVRERLEFVSAKITVFELHCPRLACGKCNEAVPVAPPAESDHQAASLAKGSRYGFGVTAQIILGKFCDHLPLYRMEDMFARAGVVVPRSTQVDLLAGWSALRVACPSRSSISRLSNPAAEGGM